MNKDQENSDENSKEKDFQPDFTVDLDAPESKDPKADQSTIQGSTAQGSTSQSEGVTSINISSIGQTMDLTPSSQPLDSGTLDLEQINGQTIDLSEQNPQEHALDGGTRLVSPSMTPFGGKVFEPNVPPQAPEVDGGTRLVGQDQNPYGQTMDIQASEDSGSAQPPDRTMLLSDSQQGSQPGSSSIAGKSSYDQTMDLHESASESKSGSDPRAGSNNIRTGQSVNASGRSNIKSMGDSQQYLKAERGIASDSIFDRIQKRTISNTIDWDNKTADYQINKKIDPKSGKPDLHVLGKGGMGLVYLATQNSVNRQVALKIIRKDKQNETFSKQFFYEAEITALLEHPNITPIYELGRTEDGVYFYTMKYILGTPWEKKIRSNSIEENLEIFDKLCDAIAFAHSKEIVHMDIKPDNVQLGEFGEVYAVDWGVASDLKRPESVRCAGTWQWISPEVARGEKSRIGKGSDIYLLGGILFQIVTGHHPRLPKDPAEKMPDAVLRKASMNNSIQPTDCKDPMVAVALKALSSEPQDRYAKVEHLQEAIHAIQKERAAIKASQELTERSIVLASQATQQGDYGRFNQSLFGLKDAIELWDNNPDAPDELKKVRLAYGQCAFDKGDYDLALQTLDRSEAQEDDLYRKAEQAQTAVKLRAERFRLLRNAFIASLVLGSGIVGSLWWKAETARSEAVIASIRAENSRKVAENAKRDETRAKEDAIAAGGKAISSGFEAMKSGFEAKVDRILAEFAKDEALKNEEKAKTQEAIAKTARKKAELQLAKTQLTEIVSQLGLARSSIAESNPSAAFGLLKGINEKIEKYKNDKLAKAGSEKDSKEAQENALITKIPELKNWSMNRISFLDNDDESISSEIKTFDLKKNHEQIGFDLEKSAMAIDPVNSHLIVGNRTGDIYRIVFDGSNPEGIVKEDINIFENGQKPMPARRIRPSKDGKKLFLGFDREKEPIVSFDLENKKKDKVEIDLPALNDLVAVSPNIKSIATSKGGTVWFVRYPDGAKLSSLANHQTAKQLHWLTDELILILSENNGRYFLRLVAPFAKYAESKSNSPDPIQLTVRLQDDVVRFAILDENLPGIVNSVSPDEIIPMKEGIDPREETRNKFSEILQSLEFLVGFSDGNLAQAKLTTSDNPVLEDEGKNNEGVKVRRSNLDVENWVLTSKFTLTRKHFHTIKDIQVQDESFQGQRNRRILTRASEEQAVQIWNLNDQVSRSTNPKTEKTTESVSHQLTLAGLPLKEQSDDLGVKLAGFTKDGKVLLVNSEFKAQLLDVDEQLSRQRLALETPFRSSTYEETHSKWLFDTKDQTCLSVDGYGVVTKYDLKQGKRMRLDPSTPTWRITQNTKPFENKEEKDKKVDKIALLEMLGDVYYWGHSPFAQVKHFAISPKGETAVTIATIPAEKSVYFVPRNTDKLAESLKFKEVCIWRIDQQTNKRQFVERLVFQSDATDVLISPLDENRFILSNSQTLTILETGTASKISDQIASTAVRLCIPNKVFPKCNAFFRVDGTNATGWIGNILSEDSKNSAQERWLSLDDNRRIFESAIPMAGCWSNDGLRLYVLDSKPRIRQFVLDPQAANLTEPTGEVNLDFLSSMDQEDTNREKTLELEQLLQIIQSNSQGVMLGISNSQSKDGSWSDELYISLNDQLTGTEGGPKNAILATFKSDGIPSWNFSKEPDKLKELQAVAKSVAAIYKSNVSQLSKDKQTLKADTKALVDSRHKPIHATADAQGKRVLLLYPRSIQCLSMQDGKNPTWCRIDRQEYTFDENPSHFSLSPDGNRLAIVDSKGLHMYQVNPSSSDHSIELGLIPGDITGEIPVQFFAWDPEGTSNRFCFIRENGTFGFSHDNQTTELGDLKDITIRQEDAEKTIQIGLSDIQRIWFFKESLVDETKNPRDSTTLRYLAIQRFKDPTKIASDNKDQDQPSSILFVQLPTSDPLDTPHDQFVSLDIDRAFDRYAVNPNGGVIITGNAIAEVGVYFISPYWAFSKLVFDANSEPDSKIESLCFAQDGKTLVISNANNHVFCLRTESPKVSTSK
ncbi:MAG: protein kinase domain-containing protein [Planctomycetota bacterium]